MTSKAKHRRELCKRCGKRPALCRKPRRSEPVSMKDHDLCLQCWRELKDSRMAQALAEAEASCG